MDNPCAITEQECFSGARIDYYVAEDGNVKPCEHGMVANMYWTGCLPCAIGTYADGSAVYSDGSQAGARRMLTVDDSSPVRAIPCRAGTFANQSGLSACYSCEPGSFSSVVSRGDACDKCPAGQECPLWGMTTGLNCTPGSYSSTSGAVQCSACRNGTVSSVQGSVECVSCNSAQHMVSPSMAGTTCVYCVGSTLDSAQCKPCGLGAYYDTQSCLMCAAG